MDTLNAKILTEGIFKDKEWIFGSLEKWKVERILLRHSGLDYLIRQRILSERNLRGKVIDIASFLGLAMDAIAVYGGNVSGTDKGDFAFSSPSGLEIHPCEGVSYITNHSVYENPPSLITCYNADWAEDMSWKGWCEELYLEGMKKLKMHGQILMTYGHKKSIPKIVLDSSTIVKLGDDLNGYEKYISVSTKFRRKRE